jgi:hypothetical protein
MAFQYYNWEEVNINWDALDLNWEEVGFLINEVLPNVGFVAGGGGGLGTPKLDLRKLNKLPEEKKRQIIKIVCKIKGEDEYISYKYKNDKDIKITADHINTILNAIKNKIKVKAENIS